MPDCATCALFQLESEADNCLHVNRPGGLALTGMALDQCDLQERASVLDIASGAGVTLNYLVHERKYHAMGIDLSEKMLQMGKERFPELPIFQADCGALPLMDDSQQAVLMECAFSLAEQTSGLLSEIKRVLLPGGKLIITDLYLRETINPEGCATLSGSRCLMGVKAENKIKKKINLAGFHIKIWSDQTPFLKQWLAQMVFRLGSLSAFYQRLCTGEKEAQLLQDAVGKSFKLGYYLMIAESL